MRFFIVSSHEERRICDDFEKKPQAVSRKTGSGSSNMAMTQNICEQTLLVKNQSKRFDWSAQRPDLNAIENLWDELKTKVHLATPPNLEEVERFTKEKWAR